MRALGVRSVLAVPMLREGSADRCDRRVAGGGQPFSDKQIELLKTFADQAVIAIENVRLFKELEARTQDLTRSVGELRALGDVGRALSSTLDLDTVLQTIVTRASQLAGTDACSIFEYDEATEEFRLRATQQPGRGVGERSPGATPIPQGSGRLRAARPLTRQPVQIPDIAAEDAYESPIRDILLQPGYRAILAVPLLREDELIGALDGHRQDARTRSRRRSSSSSRRSRPSRRWPSRTPASSGRSRTRAGSSRRPAATSPSSSPTCPTSSGRR